MLAIIISISIITALGVAVLENPQVQQWLDQQRRHLAELLRTLGPDLDPQSRREAEAFAFEGRTASNDEAIRREAQASRDAAAVATGRSLGLPTSPVRRIPVMGPSDDKAAEERRRLGREYLAKRNMEMSALLEKKGVSSPAAEEAPSSPTSFDSMVDREGKLRLEDSKLPEVPAAELTQPQSEMQQLRQPVPVAEASNSSSNPGGWGWQLGAALANPFGDEFELERSITPKPPVPPKIQLESKPRQESIRPVEPAPQPEPEARHEDLTYEEQMAIALSLSEAETSKPSATVRQNNQDEHDDDLRAAIEASLRDMDGQQAAHAVANAAPVTPRLPAESTQPLVDLTPDPPISVPQDLSRGDWSSLFDHSVGSQEQRPADPPISVPSQATEIEEEDLYSATPQLTRARLAVHNSEQGNSQASAVTMPYDPVHEAASAQREQAHLDASFYSAHSRSTSPPTSQPLSDASSSPILVDVALPTALSNMGSPADASGNETCQHQPCQDPIMYRKERRNANYERNLARIMGSGEASTTVPQAAILPSHASTDMAASTSSSEAFESLPAVSRGQTPPQQTLSAPRSEISDVEVIDVLEDSDLDLLSDEGDGVATPDSWTEVGSQDGESEAGYVEAAR